ncbi:MAG: NUDIX domain-containing protein [Candidatus Microsaccharimonas sp.]
MTTIATITEQNLGRTSHPKTWAGFTTRNAARAILLDNLNRIALMHVTNRGYYKLPGGGVDEGETVEQALVRELQEEAGATEIEIISEVGDIIEYREQWQKQSIHHCFIVRNTGNLTKSNQTEKEIDHGYEIIWADNVDIAISLVESGKPQEYGQDFERLRELTFLKYVKNNNSLGL